MDVDQIGELIDVFKAERPSGLSGQEYPDKLSVLDKLEELQDLDALDDPRVLPFLVASVANEKEFDLARMHILNMLAHWDYNEEERRMVGLVVLRLLEEDPDWNVRNYAAMAMLPFISMPGALNLVSRIVLDPNERRALRSNALAVIQRHGPTEETIAVARRLVHDPTYSKSAIRLLNTWHASAGDS